MNEDFLKHLLSEIKNGTVSLEEGYSRLKELPYENIDFARLDHHRSIRTGYSEVIFCQGKEPGHIIEILYYLGKKGDNILATRLDEDKAALVLEAFPQAYYDPASRCFLLKPLDAPSLNGNLLIMTAGTADIPVAQEAALCARYFGHHVQTLFDVGVAGIHRLLDQRAMMEQADVIIVVAGMEGALVSVVAGLVSQPVIAVPTSVGYGAHFQGLAPLLSMLNSCASGIGVVNIDNGYGAAALASSILRRIYPH